MQAGVVPRFRQRYERPWWCVGVALVSIVAQLTSLTNHFQMDDYLHLYEATTLPFARYVASTYAGHVLVTFHLALSALYAAWGFHPLGFFIVILLTHGLNAALLCATAQRFAGARSGAFFAALWGVSPVQQGAVGFVSVYGHVLALTCLLSSLLLLLRHFERDSRAAVIGSLISMLLGAGSFGVGIGIASVFPFIGGLLAPKGRTVSTLLSLAPLVVVPLVYLALVDVRQGALFGFVPLASLAQAGRFVSYGAAVLLFGPFATVDAGGQAGWPLGTLTATAVLAVGAVLWALLIPLFVWTLVRGQRRERRGLAAALSWAAVGYGMIALGRPMAFRKTLVIVATTPRYQYLPLAGLAVATAIASSCVARAIPLREARVLALAAAAYLLVVAAGSPFVGRHMLSPWLNSWAWVQKCARFLESASAAGAGDVYVLNDPFEPTHVVMSAGEKSPRYPGIAAFFATLHESDVVAGRRFHFVEADAKILAAVRSGPSPRMRGLLISQEDAARTGAPILRLADFK